MGDSSLLDGAADLGTWTPGATAVGLLSRPGARLLPLRLGLRRRADGSPWFGLALGRDADLAGGPDGIAFLDLGLELRPAAGTEPGDPPLAWQDGWLTVEVTDLDGEPTVVTTPVWPAGPTALTTLVALDVRTGLLLRAALVEARSLTVRAGAALRIDGVAARADRTVGVDLAAAAALFAAPGLTRDEARTAIGAAAVTDPPLDPDDPGAAAVLDALTDRVVARLTDTAAPGRAADDVRYVARPGAAGRALWDLAEPVPAHRYVLAGFDAVAAVREALGTSDPARLVSTATVPTLPDGRRAVTVRDTLSAELDGLVSVSAQVVAPARPPQRLQASGTRVGVRPVARAGADPVAVLRLSPAEPLAYTWRAAVLPAPPARPRTLLGPERTGSGEALMVTPDDLPVRWAALSAGPPLTAQGRVEVTVVWSDGAEALRRTTVLDADRPVARLAVPDATDPRPDPQTDPQTEPTLTAVLASPDGTRRIDLGNRPLGAWHLDVDDVPGLGATTVELECVLPDGVRLAAVEIRPNDPASPTPAAVVAFTTAQPRRTWSYVATSAWATGVRTRPWTSDAPPDAPWSDPHPPGRPVVLDLTEAPA